MCHRKVAGACRNVLIRKEEEGGRVSRVLNPKKQHSIQQIFFEYPLRVLLVVDENGLFVCSYRGLVIGKTRLSSFRNGTISKMNSVEIKKKLSRIE